MLMPSIFGTDLFDDFFDNMPFYYTDRDEKNVEKKLYGRKASHVMKTDIKETDNGYELVKKLHQDRMKQYLVTNGSLQAQTRKLKRSGLGELFDGVFISEVVGAEKPSRAFFDAVLSAIGSVDKEELLLIGDSLTSDMAGGCGAGIPCCWYDPKGLPVPEDLPIRHTIRNLNEIPQILAASK